MKKLSLYILFCCVAFSASAQTLSPSVIATAGGYYTGSTFTWSWTMGETFTPTLQDATNILTQGFEQPEVQIYTDSVPNQVCSGSAFQLPFLAYSIMGANNVFTAQLSNSSGSFASPTAVGTLAGNGTPIVNHISGNISVTIPGGTTPGTYRIRVVSSLPVFNTSDTGIALNIVNTITPAVTVTPSQNNVCLGTSVTFTASTSTGGISPLYEWTVNGQSKGNDNRFFTDDSLHNGDLVKILMTSNASCLSTPTATDSVTMNIITPQKPAVTITASDSSICAGNTVTFTALADSGGAQPVYQWQKNGLNVGGDTSVYADNSLANNDTIICVLTSNAACVSPVTVSSAGIVMKVTSNVTPSITISASNNPICSGSTVTFTAVSANGGSSPVYLWEKNGSAAGSNATTYSDAKLANNDTIICLFTSNATCVTAPTVLSNAILMQVNQSPDAGVIQTASDSICSGTIVNLSVAGSTGTIQWQSSSSTQGNFTDIKGATSASYNPILTKTTYFRVAATNGICDDSTPSFPVVVVPPPVSVFTASVNGLDATFSSAGSTSAIGYSCNFGDSTALGAGPSPVHDYQYPGTYDVCLTTRNNTDCNATTCANVTVYPDGINEISNANWTAYPDPFSNTLYINSGSASYGIESVEMFDVLGRKVLSQEMLDGLTGNLQINVSDLRSGVYYLRVSINHVTYVEPLIKQ